MKNVNSSFESFIQLQKNVCDFSRFPKFATTITNPTPQGVPPGGLITNPTPQGGTPWGFNYQPDPPGGYPPPITNPHNFQPPTEKEREGTPLTFSNHFGWEGGRGSADGVSPVMKFNTNLCLSIQGFSYIHA